MEGCAESRDLGKWRELFAHRLIYPTVPSSHKQYLDISSFRFTDMAAKERYEGLRTASCCTRDVKSQEAKPTITSQELREQPPFFDFSKLKGQSILRGTVYRA